MLTLSVVFRSRICVKNLPKYVGEDRLREVFSQKGEITDAKLMRTKEGKSRQFAFIGFRTEEEAQEALKYFNNSYLDTCRITCEVARKIGDPDAPRPWSRYALKKVETSTEEGNKSASGKSSNVKGSEGENKITKKSDEDHDPQLEEFLQLMESRSKSKMWANDTLEVPSGDQQRKIQKTSNKLKEDANEKVDMQFKPDENGSLDSNMEQKSGYIPQDEVTSDMDYFKSRVKKNWSDSESDDDSEDNNSPDERHEGLDAGKVWSKGNDDTRAGVTAEEKAKQGSLSEGSDGEITDYEVPSSSLKDEKDECLETGRLFVRNLPYTATEDELEQLFGKFGDISQVHIVVDKEMKRSKGIAYVLYAIPESAARALEELDKSIFQGRLLHVMAAKQKNPSDKQETSIPVDQSAKTFKQKREEERRASEASGNTRAWNSLFMRQDTVAENISRKFGISKGAFLDREADDLAVRIALGETQVIAETKKALRNAGVNIASLEELVTGKSDSIKRSNHVILVKNLPYGSSEGELVKLFGKFGSLDKVILPPTKTLALVVFMEPSEARAAFRGLAYKRYKDAPLYLEWAPGNILSEKVKHEGNLDDNIIGDHDAKKMMLEQHVEGLTDMEIDSDRVESRSLFVKNLNFKTTDESLKNHVSENMKEGKILSVKVKKHLKNGKNVSMGFGFIEFDSVETATNICRDLQGTVLDGHALILQLCHAKKEEKNLSKSGKDRSSTKLIVRNVAFEATAKDLRQLFSPFGQIKSLRLPKKFGNHRGFAFIEYVTKQEAQGALEALSSTHLYGRHLVLERAKEGESLEELRARTAAQFTEEQNGYQNLTKLSKKRKHVDVLDEDRTGSDRNQT
ncbi:RNA recognition motif domain [Dillenia turbinata]|uniref:RNA recognition motif domain n=1 Tax=Dillenia turbinata TaxID=194707 RepID=A0AAN8UST2_9MAGN